MSDFLHDRYLAGLVDGEGSFLIRKVSRRSSYHVMMQLGLRLDSGFVLKELAGVFGGSLSVYEIRGGANPDHKPLIRWAVVGKQDVLRLIAYFDEFGLVVKGAEYEVWREAALLYYRYAVGTGGGKTPDWLMSAMESAKTELERLKKYDAQGAEFFIKKSSKQLELFGDADAI